MSRPTKFRTRLNQLDKALQDSRVCLIGEKKANDRYWAQVHDYADGYSGTPKQQAQARRLVRLEDKAMNLVSQLQQIVFKADDLEIE